MLSTRDMKWMFWAREITHMDFTLRDQSYDYLQGWTLVPEMHNTLWRNEK